VFIFARLLIRSVTFQDPIALALKYYRKRCTSDWFWHL